MLLLAGMALAAVVEVAAFLATAPGLVLLAVLVIATGLVVLIQHTQTVSWWFASWIQRRLVSISTGGLEGASQLQVTSTPYGENSSCSQAPYTMQW